ncbi:MAG: hypothetical protein MPN21_09800 [Thermoanaerobaculia bacterium]|nr:hypothetical protein [Thermoanaerobaculia bacterium]
MEEALRDVLTELQRAHEQIARRQAELREVAAQLPSPEYDDDTGGPSNLAAAWQLGLQVHVDERLEAVVRWLARAVEWTEERFGGLDD